jgi:aryl-alcohol dehydrogenase-like predicted oxidoreductase
MQRVPLGSQGLVTSRQGLGCMGMSEFYGPGDEAQSLATIDRALELGITLLDTADIYGPYRNEELLRRALAGRRGQVVLATKFGIVRDPADPSVRGLNGTPGYVRRACEASLRRLGTDHIDLYYLHRVDPKTPIEETVGAMAGLVGQGKVRYIGLSEAGPDTIRRAHATHPLTAVQTEYSLWARHVEVAILPVLRELGIGLVPYSPLGRGFLAGAVRSTGELAADDFRRHQPRLQAGNLEHNLSILAAIERVAQRHSLTPAQVALAWVHAQGEDLVPIPGTKRRSYLEQNVAALGIRLTGEDMAELGAAGQARGERYPDMSAIQE